MQIPEPNITIASLIDKAHEAEQSAPRPHMGASMLGHPCNRWLWLSFRWAVQPKFPGRVLRLFRRGQNEEATIIADLRRIGVNVRDLSNQERVEFGSHVGGSIDAILDAGVPGAPGKKHIAEFKTHSKKSFDDLEKHGVEKSKWEHFVQMQIYMHGTKINRALYLAVCKDDDRIYTERLDYDEGVAENAIKRGQVVALSDRMPEPLSTDPSWYQCKFCPAHTFCHAEQTTQHVNCRTCAHSTATEASTWVCERHNGNEIPVQWQREGCESHVLHPDMVPWKRKEAEDQWHAIYWIDGKEVLNGEAGFGSKEILANPDACANPNPIVMGMRQEFNGQIVG
jgi:hypothetical protein